MPESADGKYQVRLEAFEGPMELLLHLIQVNKIDIYDIPIAALTEQYIWRRCAALISKWPANSS